MKRTSKKSEIISKRVWKRALKCFALLVIIVMSVVFLILIHYWVVNLPNIYWLEVTCKVLLIALVLFVFGLYARGIRSLLSSFK